MSYLEPLGTGFLGTALSYLYRIALLLQEIRFSLLPPTKFPFPIISVGGISAGGTGKTPLTGSIIEYLIEQGYTPVLISRGYGRESKGTTIVVPQAPISWQEVGDEPAMLRARYANLWLVIGAKRKKALTALLPQLPSRAIGIMDDGFQHRAVARDCDIVTLPATLLEDALIPAGKLREPLTALTRATILVTIDTSIQKHKILTQQLHQFLEAPLFSATMNPVHWRHTLSGKEFESLPKTTTLFSGIARPERFIKSATARCQSIVNTCTFPDHHIYLEADYKRITAVKTDQWGTTEKDLQRLNAEKREILEKLYYLVINFRCDNDNELHAIIDQKIRGHYA